jgi:hypothetical protein
MVEVAVRPALVVGQPRERPATAVSRAQRRLTMRQETSPREAGGDADASGVQGWRKREHAPASDDIEPDATTTWASLGEQLSPLFAAAVVTAVAGPAPRKLH